MNYKKTKIKEGINLHVITTKKFKTNLIFVFLTTPLVRDNITKEAIISAILRRGNMKKNTQEDISKELENMYGASFNCGIEKVGDQHITKFYIEAINEEFLPEKENILEQSIENLFDIIFNPLVENEAFNEEYFKSEKENIKQIIKGKIDNKSKYAVERCIEEMYKGKPYGLYKFGYVEDLQEMSAQDLYKYYKTKMQECKIDIFVSGNVENDEVEKLVKENIQIQNLESRDVDINLNEESTKEELPKIVNESMQITQGKLVLGLDVEKNQQEDKYITLIYNMILGGGANSKLFQNVREKASLAYTASSSYIRQKNSIIIHCGIEIQNYEKALDIVKEQIEDIKNGKFSQEDLERAKLNIISTIKFIPEEQDTEVSYYFGQEFTQKVISLEEYAEKINSVTKEQIIDIAKSVNINTIYFLKD